jgi:hypothetical protein
MLEIMGSDYYFLIYFLVTWNKVDNLTSTKIESCNQKQIHGSDFDFIFSKTGSVGKNIIKY